MLKAIMFQVAGDEGLKAQVGVPGLKKRSPKKGWIFLKFLNEDDSTIPDSSDLRTLQGRVEGVLFSDVKIHAEGVLSGKPVEGVDLTPHWGQEIKEIRLDAVEVAAAVLTPRIQDIQTGRLPSTIPAPANEASTLFALLPKETKKARKAEYLQLVPEGRTVHEERWLSKSDEARFRIWKRYTRQLRVAKGMHGRRDPRTPTAISREFKYHTPIQCTDPRGLKSDERRVILRGLGILV